MAISEITDHVNRALSRIKTQFRSSADVRGLVSALALEVQVLESAIIGLQNYFRSAANSAADGKIGMLTRLQKLVGARSPTSALIIAQIAANKSQGAFDDLISLFTVLVEPTHGQPFLIDDSGETPIGGSGVFLIICAEVPGQTISLEAARDAIALMQSAAPSGNRVILTCSVEPLENDSVQTFKLDSAGRGFDGAPTNAFVSAFDNPNF